ncbi:MAG: tetratricopeptide repeat protein [Acidobacteriota bacterium]|nr:tetratricopeptide repeat protein [Acidobacteriota bacterium]
MRSRILACLAVCCLAVANADAQTARVLVMPFDVTPQAAHGATYWAGEAGALLVADALQARGYGVFTRAERAAAFEELELPASTPLSRATILKIAQLMGASDVIVGTLTLEGDSAAMRVRSVRVEAGRAQADVAERGALRDLMVISGRVADRLVEQTLRAPRGATVPPPPAPPLPAFESYVKGLVAATPPAREKFLRDALALAPGYGRANLALWELLDEQDRHEEALAEARKVPATSVLERSARFAAALSLIALERYDEAFTQLDALRASGASPVIDNAQGVIQLRRAAAHAAGKPVYFFNKAAERDPDDSDFLFNLGYAYALERDNTGALYWLREAVRRAPADGEAHLLMAVVLDASGRTAEAQRERDLARLLGATAGAPGVPRELERLRTDLVTGSLGTSEALITNPAQREQQELSAFHLDRGRRLFDQEQDREAALELRRAIYLSPYLPDAHLLLGRIYRRASRVSEAIDAFRISIWSRETAAARLALAEALLANDQREEARIEAARALELDPDNAAVKALLDRIK